MSNGTSVTPQNPISGDACACSIGLGRHSVSVVVTVAVAAIDRCGGHDEKGVPGSSDRELEPRVPGLKSEGEAVRVPAARRARMTSRAWTD